MAEHLAFSELRLQGDLDQDLAFRITLQQLQTDSKIDQIDSNTLTVFPFHDIELLKRMLLRKIRASSWLKISDIQIYYNGVELANRRLLISFANQSDSEIILQWKVREKLGHQICTRGIRGVGGARLSTKYLNWIDSITAAFQKNIHPKLTDEGTGSSYILYNLKHKPVAIFKPQNEEAFCPFNPRGYIGRMGQKGFRSGVFSGEGWIREVAAYYLDAYYGSLSNVPPTLIVEGVHPRFCYDPSRMGGEELVMNGLFRRRLNLHETNDLYWKIGSLQMYISNHESCGDYDPSVFSVADVHKIGILDIRVCNMDRNEGNILVIREDQKFLDHRLIELLDHNEFTQTHPRYQQQNLLLISGGGGGSGGSGGGGGGSGGSGGGGGGGGVRSTGGPSASGMKSRYRLIPIDHGLTLPDSFDVIDFDLIWIRWPQSRIGFSQDELDYIERLKPDKDAEWLKSKLDIRSECLRTMQVSTRLLKKGAKLGFNLYQISMCLVRLSPNKPSILESWLKLAITQTWYSCYQSNLVKQRSNAMTCIMDLATPQDTTAPIGIPRPPRAGGGGGGGDGSACSGSVGGTSGASGTSAATSAGVLKRSNSQEDSFNAQNRSRTSARSSIADQDLLNRTAQKLRYYTNWRKSTNSSKASEDIWSIEDVSGRHITLDWQDPKILKRFLDAFENILSLRLPAEIVDF